MPFSLAQQQAIDTRNKNILVSASAGSGKTSVLVERLCRLVLDDHVSIDSILAMTFTEDAAGEMKIRLMKSLQEMPQDDYIRSQLALLETASICTIDSFCLSILQNYYYKVPISYTMSKTVASTAQTNKAFLDAYNEACEKVDPYDFSQLKLFFSSHGKNEDDIQSAIKALIDTALSKPEPVNWIKSQMNEEISDEVYYWFYKYFHEQISSMIDICVEMHDVDDELFDLKKLALEKCLEHLDNKDYPSFKKQFEIYFSTTPAFKKTINKVSYEDIQGEFKKKEANIASVLFEQDLFIQDRKDNLSRIKTFCMISIYTMELFAKKKEAMEVIDFTDMEHFAYKLLKQPMIQEEIRNKYQVILVDEFQDTNDLQENIIQCFARVNNVFRVGDIKQSIYGFRQAKPEIMLSHMQKKDEHSRLIVLDENYRSNQSIVEFNNDFYNKIMNTELLGNNFSDDDIAKVGTPRQIETEQYPVRFLYTEYLDWIENQDEKYTKIQAKSLHKKNLMDLIAQDILEKHKLGTPFKSICILTRTHAPQEELKKVLEAYDIPVLAEIDHGFYTNHAIQIVLATLSSLYDPEDDISLLASLCSPIGNVTTEQIALACTSKERNASLYSTIKDQPFIEEWKSLKRYIHEPIVEIIRKIYDHNDFYYEYTTNQDKTNLDLFLELASQFENQDDVKAFVDQMKNNSTHDSVGEAYPYGKDADVVKIKTMHHSKGLQFPIVYILSSHESKDKYSNNPVLIDSSLGISFSSLEPSLKVKRTSLSHIAMVTKKFHDDLKEEMRVFYVATTRSEKELVIVDYIDELKTYEKPLNTRSLLQRTSYTGWLLHTYAHDPNSLLKLDKKYQLYDRPNLKRKDNLSHEKLVYSKPVDVLESKTASKSKLKLEWPEITLTKNMGTIRGTLFHEIVAQCNYPYKEDECVSFATSHNYKLTSTDLEQILSLNDCQEYASWIKARHEFECSYIIRENNEIIHGFMDLVVWLDDRIYILDFKTDTVSNENELVEKYHTQLETYKDSMAQIEKNKPIYTAIYSFHLKKLIF